MASSKKSSTIKTYTDLNAAVSRIYHYACGVCNAKTVEDVKTFAKELTDTVVDITNYKISTLGVDTGNDKKINI